MICLDFINKGVTPRLLHKHFVGGAEVILPHKTHRWWKLSSFQMYVANFRELFKPFWPLEKNFLFHGESLLNENLKKHHGQMILPDTFQEDVSNLSHGWQPQIHDFSTTNQNKNLQISPLWRILMYIFPFYTDLVRYDESFHCSYVVKYWKAVHGSV